jgi:hypothetical protein
MVVLGHGWKRDQSKLKWFGLDNHFIKNNGVEKMAKEQEKTKEFIPTAPAFQGSGVSVWINKDKNGNDYLSVSVLGGKSVNCFKPKPKEE